VVIGSTVEEPDTKIEPDKLESSPEASEVGAILDDESAEEPLSSPPQAANGARTTRAATAPQVLNLDRELIIKGISLFKSTGSHSVTLET
jgi:hypothetical protein